MLGGDQKLWLQWLQLGPPVYWLLERAQTWVSTEGGRIQSSVDKRVGATLVQRSRVRIPVPARFFDAKFFCSNPTHDTSDTSNGGYHLLN